VTINHVGVCVADLDRSRRFYEALGFRPALDLELPDEPTHRLLGLEPPLGLRAVYLTMDTTFVLELLHFADAPPPPREARAMNEIGLTHLSIGVDDLDAACDVVASHGGEVLHGSRMGAVAVMVRDPDGQLIELLDRTRRPVDPGLET